MLLLRDIFGQDDAVRQLRSAWQSDRLPHGLIFAGPPGVGKGTAAGAVAAWFLCEQPGSDDACGKCASCHLVSAGTHPDYHVIYRQLIRLDPRKKDHKASVLSIDLIENYLMDPAARKAMQGRGKVFIIEEAELLSRDAGNSMLKTLEEPQGRTLIILLTDQLHSLLPTIRSRCQSVRFGSLPDALVIEKLTQRGANADDAEMATVVASGSLGLASRWIEDGIIERARQLHDLLNAILGGKGAEVFPAWIATAGADYAAKQEERDANISKDQTTREGIILYLRLAADNLRARLADADAAQQMRLCHIIDDLAQGQTYIDGNVNTGLVLEHLANRFK